MAARPSAAARGGRPGLRHDRLLGRRRHGHVDGRGVPRHPTRQAAAAHRAASGTWGFGVVGDGPALDLGGEFGRRFSLHVAPGYERDALYLFTPDVLAALLDEAQDFALEIVDDWLFLYTTALDVSDPETHRRMRRLSDVVGRELRDQSRRYRDERVERDVLTPLVPNRVAPAGRRLPTFVWVPGILLALAIASSPFWGAIVGAIERMLRG